MSQLVAYVDASNLPDENEYPEIIAELEHLGFARVGQILVDMDSATAEELASAYGAEDGADFLEHWDVPTPVFVSRDGTTFADVSWWWGGPHVRFRTELADGSLVETNRRWDNEPGLPRALRFLWRPFNIDREMVRASVPRGGRSIEIMAGPDTGALWRKHRDHVSRFGGERQSGPATYRTLADYIRIATQAVGHDEKVTRKVTRLWLRTLLSWGAVSIGAILLLATTASRDAASTAAVVALILTPIITYLVPSRMRWLPQSWRPHYH